MRQNIALLLIAVVVLAGAAGILATSLFYKANNTTNMSLNISNNTTPNNTTKVNNTQKTSSSQSGSDNDNGSNVNNGNNPSGEGHWETCPTCGGARFIQDPSDPHGDSIICPTCHGDGRIWVSD